jgi:hypothetical protein
VSGSGIDDTVAEVGELAGFGVAASRLRRRAALERHADGDFRVQDELLLRWTPLHRGDAQRRQLESKGVGGTIGGDERHGPRRGLQHGRIQRHERRLRVERVLSVGVHGRSRLVALSGSCFLRPAHKRRCVTGPLRLERHGLDGEELRAWRQRDAARHEGKPRMPWVLRVSDRGGRRPEADARNRRLLIGDGYLVYREVFGGYLHDEPDRARRGRRRVALLRAQQGCGQENQRGEA